MNPSLRPFAAALQAGLTLVAGFLPYLAQIHTAGAYGKPATSFEVRATAEAFQAPEAVSELVPQSLFITVPGETESANALAVFHDSGEVGLVPEMPLGKDGRLGKLKRIFGVWGNSADPFEMKIAAMGGKVSVKTPEGATASITLNKSTNKALVRLKWTNLGKSSSASGTVDISSHGAFWFESVQGLLGFSKSNSLFRFVADYGAIESQSAIAPRGIPSGSTILGNTESAKLAELGWLLTKVAGITAGIIGGSLAVVGASVPLAIFGGVVGFGAAITGVYDLIFYKQPPGQDGLVDGVFKTIGTSTDVVGYGEAIRDVVNALRGGMNILKSGAVWDSFFNIMNKLLEKPSHALSKGMVLMIIYSWPASQNDLDTATTFLGETVGYDCGSTSTYMSWTGDDTGSGGTEQVTCRISEAAENLVLPGQFSIGAKAGWYASAGGSGPASLEMYLQNPVTGTLYGPKQQLTINPGSQTGCATTVVGSASFTWNPATTRMTWSFN